MSLIAKGFEENYKKYFAEDDLEGNAFYLRELPSEKVECLLKIKSDVYLSGLPFFVGAFNYLGASLDYEQFKKYEGQFLKKGEVITFELPFHLALTGERVALNLLQQSTRISTYTKKYLDVLKNSKIKLVDTRKTTPGLRLLEKYAVRTAGAYNHRFSQADVWMIKDNHKTFFGGLKPAWDYFQSMQTFYQNTVVEIHSIEELKEAFPLGVKHVMLDNFSPEQIKEAVKIKIPTVTYEISGGLKLETLTQYMIEGVDVMSVGALTHSAPHVDLSMKIKKLG